MSDGTPKERLTDALAKHFGKMPKDKAMEQMKKLDDSLTKPQPSLLGKKIILTHLLHLAQEFNRWSIETCNQCRLIAAEIEKDEKNQNIQSSLRWSMKKKKSNRKLK